MTSATSPTSSVSSVSSGVASPPCGASAPGALPTIRSLRTSDIRSLQRLDRQAHGEAWSHATFADQIDRAGSTHLVACNADDEPIGHAACWLDGSTLRVINVACDAASTGRGVATRLLAQLLRQATTSVNVAEVVLEVRPRNRRAQRLYSRFGFAPAGFVRGFYPRPDVAGSRDALVMRIDEPASPAWRRRLDKISQGVAR